MEEPLGQSDAEQMVAGAFNAVVAGQLPQNPSQSGVVGSAADESQRHYGSLGHFVVLVIGQLSQNVLQLYFGV